MAVGHDNQQPLTSQRDNQTLLHLDGSKQYSLSNSLPQKSNLNLANAVDLIINLEKIQILMKCFKHATGIKSTKSRPWETLWDKLLGFFNKLV